jgi:predicted acyl esterase
VAYLTEGCLRFIHRRMTGPSQPARLGAPRSFARTDSRDVVPGQYLDLVVELQPVSALIRAGHRIRVAIAGNDGSCFARYGPPEETFTLELGKGCYLDLPLLNSPTEVSSVPQQNARVVRNS